MPNSDQLSRAAMTSTPDYRTLVRFLLEPLLDDPQSLKVDCECLSSIEKVWVRVAFEQEDKGKVFGRGGRNLRAIETVLNTCAAGLHQRVYLDVFGHSEPAQGRERERERGDRSSFSRGRGESAGRRTRSSAASRPRSPKPAPQLRTLDEG